MKRILLVRHTHRI